MKKLIYLSAIFLTTTVSACSSKNCKDCSGCLTKASVELCEDDFEKTSDFNDKIDDMVSDGCTCKDQ